MTDILMPALSPTMEQGTLTKWLVAVGDAVKAGDLVAEIETDKASMEVEAVDDGFIGAILVPAGSEDVKVNTPIARLQKDGLTPAQSATAEPVLSPAVRRIVTEEGLNPADVQGSGRDGRLTKGDVLAAAEGAAKPFAASANVNASPLAARIAHVAGIDVGKIAGSGPEGRILKADLDAALGRAAAPSPNALPAFALAAPDLAGPAVSSGAYDLQPLNGMRRTIAERMTQSFRDVPHFPLSVDIELDAILRVRAQINGARPADDKVSLNDFIIKAAAQALRQVPEANASYTPQGVALHHHADIAVAVAIDGGLITPIVRAAETKGIGAIAEEMADLIARARDKRLRPEEYQGGTFSISNLGMFGIRNFSSILNEPQGAILSVGAGDQRPVVKDGELAIATVMSVTLTCDHRAMDGATGARFVTRFKALLSEPLLLLA